MDLQEELTENEPQFPLRVQLTKKEIVLQMECLCEASKISKFYKR